MKKRKKKLDIIYEDKEILVVNKPSGMLTVSTPKEKEKTLFHEVSSYVKKSNPKAKVFIIHRLDKDTSGIVMFAKNQKKFCSIIRKLTLCLDLLGMFIV